MPDESRCPKCPYTARRSYCPDLRQFPLFSGLDLDRILPSLCLLGVCRLAAAKGTRIITEGTAAGVIWLLIDGLVHVTKRAPGGRSVALDISRRGEPLDLTSALGCQTHDVGATCLTPATLLAISASWLRDISTGDATLSRRLSACMYRRLARIDETRSLLMEPAICRIASILERLAADLGPVIPLSRHQLGELVGATPETCSRALNLLQRVGWLFTERNRITMREPDHLREFVAQADPRSPAMAEEDTRSASGHAIGS